MNKNTKQPQNVIEKIISNMDSFSEIVNMDKLANILSGQTTNIEISNFLLNIESNGNSQRKLFKLEYSGNIDGFEVVEILQNRIESTHPSHLDILLIAGYFFCCTC